MIMKDEKNIQKNLEAIATMMVKEMKALVKMNGSYASGELYNSLRVKTVKDTKDIWHFKYSMIYYGLFVDQGTRPGHYPNIGSLMEWARYKGIPLDRVPAIAENIFKRGTKAHPFTTPFQEDSKVVKKMMDEMGELFKDNALEQILADAKYFKGRIK